MVRGDMYTYPRGCESWDDRLRVDSRYRQLGKHHCGDVRVVMLHSEVRMNSEVFLE